MMLVDPRRPSVHEALRNHVSLQVDVSDALTVFQEREGESLSVVLSEARCLAGQLEPRTEGAHQSQANLEHWLGAVLHGPHDKRWFDERVRSGLRGWSDLPQVAHILVLGNVRERLTELATSMSPNLISGRERITDALARLFDFELALIQLDLNLGDETAGPITELDPLNALPGEASVNLRNALSVVETSVYLVRRYSERSAGQVNIGRHLERILKQLHRTKLEIVRLVGGATFRRQSAT